MCNDLQSSAARPAIIGQIRPTFGETIGGAKPELSGHRQLVGREPRAGRA
jgi:hypothetical protein